MLLLSFNYHVVMVVICHDCHSRLECWHKKDSQREISADPQNTCLSIQSFTRYRCNPVIKPHQTNPCERPILELLSPCLTVFAQSFSPHANTKYIRRWSTQQGFKYPIQNQRGCTEDQWGTPCAFPPLRVSLSWATNAGAWKAPGISWLISD